MIRMSKVSKVLLISLLITTTIGATAYSMASKKPSIKKNEVKVTSKIKENCDKNERVVSIDNNKKDEDTKVKSSALKESKKDMGNKSVKGADAKKSKDIVVDKENIQKRNKKETKKVTKEEKKIVLEKEKIVDKNNTELSKEEIIKKARTALDLWYSNIENFENAEYETIKGQICYTSPKFTSKDQIADVFKVIFTKSEANKIADRVCLVENGKLYIIVGQIGDVITYTEPIIEFKAVQQGNEIKVNLTEKRGSAPNFQLRKQELKFIRENGKWVFSKCWFLFN